MTSSRGHSYHTAATPHMGLTSHPRRFRQTVHKYAGTLYIIAYKPVPDRINLAIQIKLKATYNLTPPSEGTLLSLNPPLLSLVFNHHYHSTEQFRSSFTSTSFHQRSSCRLQSAVWVSGLAPLHLITIPLDLSKIQGTTLLKVHFRYLHTYHSLGTTPRTGWSVVP